MRCGRESVNGSSSSQSGIRDQGSGIRRFEVRGFDVRRCATAEPMDRSRRSAPFGVAFDSRELLDERRWQHFGEASASGLQAALLQDASEIQAIARACQRHVEQPLRLLPLLRRIVFVGVGPEIADRDRHLVPAGAGDDANRITEAAGPAREVDEKDDRKLESLRGVDRHQVHGVERIDHRVGFVADREAVEVRGNAAERRVAAVLDAANQRAHLLQVLARLQQPRAAHLHEIRRLGQHEIEQLGGRQPIDEPSPSRA